MSIRRRIAVASASAVAITMLLVIVGSWVIARQQLIGPIDESLLRRSEAFADVPGGIRPNLGLGLRRTEALIRRLPGDFDSTYYQIIFADGSTIDLGEEGVVLPPPDDDDLYRPEPSLRSVRVEGLHLRVATSYNAPTDTHVQIARSLAEADETLRSFAVRLGIFGLIGIAIAAALGMLVSRNTVRPIEALRDEVAAIAATEELGERVGTGGDDEVAQLASSFNALLQQLEASRAEQVRLVRDAGHELRTPLTALRMNLEVLQRHDVPEGEREAILRAANAEVEELSDLVNEIVDLATDRYEEEPIRRVSLGSVAEKVAERTQRRNGRIVRIAADDSEVMGKPDALERAIANIVSNADAWSPEGEEIVLRVEGGLVTVSDTGPGFHATDLPHVFERFYRSAEARTRPGSGLGLSIVAQIVDDHGGETIARNRDDGRGAVVGFRIPVASEQVAGSE